MFRCFEVSKTRFAKSVREVGRGPTATGKMVFGGRNRPASARRGFACVRHTSRLALSMFRGFDVSSSMFRVRCFEVSRFGNAFREKCRGRRPWVSRNWKNGFERSGPSSKRASRLSVVDVSMFRRFEVDRDHYTERFRSRSFRVPGTLGEEQLSREAPQDVTTLVPYMRGART